MFTRLLQAALITFAVYLTMLISPPPLQQSISGGAGESLSAINAQIQPKPNPRQKKQIPQQTAPIDHLKQLKQQLVKAVGSLSRPLEGNAKF